MRYHVMYSSNKEGNRSVYIASSYRNEKGQAGKIFIANVEMRRCCLRQTLCYTKN